MQSAAFELSGCLSAFNLLMESWSTMYATSKTMFIALATSVKEGIFSSGFFSGIVGVISSSIHGWVPAILALQVMNHWHGNWLGATGDSGMRDYSDSEGQLSHHKFFDWSWSSLAESCSFSSSELQIGSLYMERCFFDRRMGFALYQWQFSGFSIIRIGYWGGIRVVGLGIRRFWLFVLIVLKTVRIMGIWRLKALQMLIE